MPKSDWSRHLMFITPSGWGVILRSNFQDPAMMLIRPYQSLPVSVSDWSHHDQAFQSHKKYRSIRLS